MLLSKDGKARDSSYFDGLNKEQILDCLSHREQDRSLVDFIKDVAPDYVTNNQVDSFILCDDLKLF